MWKILDSIFPPRADDLALRAVTYDGFLSHMEPALVPVTRPGTVALFPFSYPPVRAAIHEAKYHGSDAAFDLLARSLAEYLCDADDAGSAPILLPMPLGKRRRQERGFNQSEVIARRAFPEGPVSVDTTFLIRVRDTDSQVSLPKGEREKNMQGAFRTAAAPDPRRTYIILDDVLTTGATMQAAIDALKRAGAVHLLPVAIAH